MRSDSSRRHTIRVHPLPAWVDARRLIGQALLQISAEADGWLRVELVLPRAQAADLQARLHNVGFGGRALAVEVEPPLPRSEVRRARSAEARRRRSRSPGFARRGVQLDDEARWSLTPEAIAFTLGRRVRGARVIDAGCGAGGNAIGFARAGAAVIAIDQDEKRLSMARHNAALYGVAKRITFLAGDARDIVPTLRADVLFVDPPWGRVYDKTLVTLADMPLLEALLAQRARFARVWAKVPPSFDVASIPGARAEAFFGVGKGDAQRVKLVLLELSAQRA